jgi:hypothetical protein
VPRITPRSEAELILARQRRELRVLARKVKSGEPLNDRERVLAAATIKAWADQCMNWQPPKRKRGRKGEGETDQAAVAFRFAWLIHGDSSGANALTRNAASEAVAEEFGISDTFVKKICKEHGEFAELLIAGHVKPKAGSRKENQVTKYHGIGA